MLNKKEKIFKLKILNVLYSYILTGPTIFKLDKYFDLICEKYLPGIDCVFKNEFHSFVLTLNNLCFMNSLFDKELKEYFKYNLFVNDEKYSFVDCAINDVC